MSSPPPATSPTSPYSGSFPLPKKRPSLTIPPGGPSNSKRRKPSSVSSTSHPLRQTSFPPPETTGDATSPARQASFSPSVSSSVARGSSKPKRKRPSAPRSTTATNKDDAAAPATQTDAPPREDEDPDDEDDAADDTVLEGGAQLSEAAKKQEQKHIAMLMEAFSEEQLERYSTWRRVKLKKETVRKITNQTLSQSVPASIVTAINGFTKVFVGELVEGARDVQAEWVVAGRRGDGEARGSRPASRDGEVVEGSSPRELTQGSTTERDTQETLKSLSTDRAKGVAVDEGDRGPLTPDHLREALRRYKKDREGGSAGFQGMSMLGRETTASRVGSKRLFR